MRRAIVLLSGGLDSTVTLYYAKKQNFKIHCLTFDYNQRHRQEVKAASKIARLAKVKHNILKITLPSSGSSLLDRKLVLPKRPLLKMKEMVIPTTYVPARNIVFLSYALSYAEAQNADYIFIGVNSIDYSGYPDCRVEFLKAFMKMAELGTKRGVEKNPVKIVAPLIKKSKAEIIRLGRKLKVPFEYTRSCYEADKLPCGLCDSCKLRAKGFEEAGFEDPLYAKRRG